MARAWKTTRAHFYFTDHEGIGPRTYYCDLEIAEDVPHDMPEVRSATYRRDPDTQRWGSLTWAPLEGHVLLEKAWSNYLVNLTLGPAQESQGLLSQ